MRHTSSRGRLTTVEKSFSCSGESYLWAAVIQHAIAELDFDYIFNSDKFVAHCGFAGVDPEVVQKAVSDQCKEVKEIVEFIEEIFVFYGFTKECALKFRLSGLNICGGPRLLSYRKASNATYYFLFCVLNFTTAEAMKIITRPFYEQVRSYRVRILKLVLEEGNFLDAKLTVTKLLGTRTFYLGASNAES